MAWSGCSGVPPSTLQRFAVADGLQQRQVCAVALRSVAAVFPPPGHRSTAVRCAADPLAQVGWVEAQFQNPPGWWLRRWTVRSSVGRWHRAPPGRAGCARHQLGRSVGGGLGVGRLQQGVADALAQVGQLLAQLRLWERRLEGCRPLVRAFRYKPAASHQQGHAACCRARGSMQGLRSAAETPAG